MKSCVGESVSVQAEQFFLNEVLVKRRLGAGWRGNKCNAACKRQLEWRRKKWSYSHSLLLICLWRNSIYEWGSIVMSFGMCFSNFSFRIPISVSSKRMCSLFRFLLRMRTPRNTSQKRHEIALKASFSLLLALICICRTNTGWTDGESN